MNSLNILWFGLLSCCFLSTQAIESNSADSTNAVRQATECQNIMDLVCEVGIFDTLCMAMNATGLDELFGSEEVALTLFAPTDEAFAKLGNARIDALFMNTPTLTDLLLFHTYVDSDLQSFDLVCTKRIEMANGRDSRTVCRSGLVYQNGSGNTADARPQIIDGDIMACNGVIHAIDGVMLPYDLDKFIPVTSIVDPTLSPTLAPTVVSTIDANQTESPECDTITDVICGDLDFEYLCSMLNTTGLDANLSEGIYTIFAPNDSAFEKLGEATVEGWLVDMDALSDIVLFQMVEGKEIASTDLKCTELTKMANGKDSRTVCMDGTVHQKGGGNNREEAPEIILADMFVCNGVIHVVDEVLLP